MDYWHKKWQCPFFIWDDITKVVCEGGCVLIFPDKVAAKEFMEKYCASSKWETCSVAEMMLRHYDREEEKNEKKPERIS